MKAHVILDVPGEERAQMVSLDEGESLLVGREPDAARVGSAQATALRTSTVPSPSVSANHLLIRRAGGVTSVVDEHSKNGTWLRLPPGDPVEVRSEQPLMVKLSAQVGASGERLDEQPAEATWTGSEDFHQGVEAAVSRWLEARSYQVRVGSTQAGSDDDEIGRAGRIPLANGRDLRVMPTGTVDARWEEALGVLWRYVEAQNLLYSIEEDARGEGVVLASPAIRRAHRQVVEAARRGLRLMLIGPSGSGKEGLARAYHRYSGRGGVFVAKNCSMFSREFLRAELFGAEQGSYTGAVRGVVGAVERAHDGTLFLDEVGEIALELQPMLLTFLDRGEYERLGGGGKLRRADARVVSATNRDLRAATAQGQFREELWFRLAGKVVTVPPLRERPEDIEGYLRLRRFLNGMSAHRAMQRDALERVLSHPWRGNFRELASFVDQLPEVAGEGELREGDCAAILRDLSLGEPGSPAASPPAAAAPASEVAASDLAQLAQVALEAFRTDASHDLERWGDVTQYLERYLKPLLFAEVSGAAGLERREHADVPSLAQRIDADRGTVNKQLGRFFERFWRK
jgi:DNA-binding NtrC family response regulator